MSIGTVSEIQGSESDDSSQGVLHKEECVKFID